MHWLELLLSVIDLPMHALQAWAARRRDRRLDALQRAEDAARREGESEL